MKMRNYQNHNFDTLVVTIVDQFVLFTHTHDQSSVVKFYYFNILLCEDSLLAIVYLAPTLHSLFRITGN